MGKNRHGEQGTAYMHSQLKYCQFSNLDSQAIEQIQRVGVWGVKFLLQVFICGLVVINTGASNWTTFQSFMAILVGLIFVELLSISSKLRGAT